MPDGPLTGACLCGAVRFELRPPVRDVLVCHCRQCARWTGHVVAAAAVAPQNFAMLSGSVEVGWYAASSHAVRGFCRSCGSSLFWKPKDGSRIAVLAGALEPPTHLRIAAHIFVASKSDYYEICDGAPRFEAGASHLAELPAGPRPSV
jgi:hypothetical protein